MTLVRAIEAVAERRRRGRLVRDDREHDVVDGLFLAPEWASAIFGDPDIVTGGVFAPNGTGSRVEGGHARDRAVAVGERHQPLHLDPRRHADRRRRVPPDVRSPPPTSSCSTPGTRRACEGTGSTDFRMTERLRARRPLACSRSPAGSRSTAPLAAFPNFNLLAAGVAAVALGIARRAVDEIVALAQGKTPLFSSKTLAASSARPGATSPGPKGPSAPRRRFSSTS